MNFGWLGHVNTGPSLGKKNKLKNVYFKCTTLVSNVDNRRGYGCVGTEDIWEISISPSQFSYTTKWLKKKINKVYQKSKRRKVFETDLYLGKGWEKGEPALRYLLTIFFALETIFSFPFKEMQMKRKQDKIICKRTYIPSGVTLLPLKNPLLLIHH